MHVMDGTSETRFRVWTSRIRVRFFKVRVLALSLESARLDEDRNLGSMLRRIQGFLRLWDGIWM